MPTTAAEFVSEHAANLHSVTQHGCPVCNFERGRKAESERIMTILYGLPAIVFEGDAVEVANRIRAAVLGIGPDWDAIYEAIAARPDDGGPRISRALVRKAIIAQRDAEWEA